jgi:hypothetical protein
MKFLEGLPILAPAFLGGCRNLVCHSHSPE